MYVLLVSKNTTVLCMIARLSYELCAILANYLFFIFGQF